MARSRWIPTSLKCGGHLGARFDLDQNAATSCSALTCRCNRRALIWINWCRAWCGANMASAPLKQREISQRTGQHTSFRALQLPPSRRPEILFKHQCNFFYLRLISLKKSHRAIGNLRLKTPHTCNPLDGVRKDHAISRAAIRRYQTLHCP